MANNSGRWEPPGQGFLSGVYSNGNNFIRSPPYGTGSVFPPTVGRPPAAPPPLPPRPANNIYNSYNSQGSYFNNFGFGGYPAYGYGYRPGFNTYGYGYGCGQNGFYNANNPESRFIQLAEESSRPAFQAIQSVLQSFSSVAMMFDSTFNALYSSYMSVISVADNFGRLRSIFSQVFSLLAVLRVFQSLYRRFLYYIGLSKNNPETERLWVDAFRSACGGENAQRPWSTMLFLSIIMAGPYLLFKLMSRIYPNPMRETWNPMQNPGSAAVGMYNFNSSNEQELSFSVNEKLMIAPERFQPSNSPGWLLACNGKKKIGLVPNSYVGIMMQSEKTGRTYVEYNGQKYQPSISFESEFLENSGEGSSNNTTKVADEKEREVQDKSLE